MYGVMCIPSAWFLTKWQLAECLSQGVSIPEMLNNILHKPAVHPSQYSDLSAGFESLILKCIERDRARRYQSMDEVLLALSNVFTAESQGDLSSIVETALEKIKNKEAIAHMPTEAIRTSFLLESAQLPSSSEWDSDGVSLGQVSTASVSKQFNVGEPESERLNSVSGVGQVARSWQDSNADTGVGEPRGVSEEKRTGPYLILLKGAHGAQADAKYELGEETNIGRVSENDIVLNSASGIKVSCADY
jgi:hypothetical protein